MPDIQQMSCRLIIAAFNTAKYALFHFFIIIFNNDKNSSSNSNTMANRIELNIKRKYFWFFLKQDNNYVIS